MQDEAGNEAANNVSRLMELPVLLDLVRDTLYGTSLCAFAWLPCVYLALRLGGTRCSRKVFIAFIVLECLAIAWYARYVSFWLAFRVD